MTDEGLVVHMLIEKKYPLKKEIVNEELSIPEQTATVKENQIRLMAGSLPKLQSQLSWIICNKMLPEYLKDVAELLKRQRRLLKKYRVYKLRNEEENVWIHPPVRNKKLKGLSTELRESRTQIAKLQRKQIGNNNKITLARFRIANLEQIIEEIQVHHQADKESLLDAIYEHKNSQEGPSDY
ncbi:hypothetical protein Tco_0948880 [Tanacetum coccineum]